MSATPASVAAEIEQAESLIAQAGTLQIQALTILAQSVTDVGTLSVPPPPTAPAFPPPLPAAAAGWPLVLLDDFTSASIDPTGAATSGFLWYPDHGATEAPSWTNGQVLSGGNWFVAPTLTAAELINGNTGGGSFPSPNGGILVLNGPVDTNNSTLNSTPVSTRFNSMPAQGTFSHGLFRVYAQVRADANFSAAKQWYAPLWLFSQMAAQAALLSEIDVVEIFAGNFGTQDWGPHGLDWNSSTDEGSYPTSGYPTIQVDNNFHLYDCLWEEISPGVGQISFYIDGQLANIPGITQPITTGTGGPVGFQNLETGVRQTIYMGGPSGSDPSGISGNINIDYILAYAQPGVVTAAPPPPPPPPPVTTTETIGQTSVFTGAATNSANFLIAQKVTNATAGTLESLSFDVNVPAGQMYLGVYDASGAGGGPGKLLATTAEFTPAAGWNTEAVVGTPTLPASTFWLAFIGNNNTLSYYSNATGSGCYVNQTFGALPATFPTGFHTEGYNWSFYATLQVTSADPPTGVEATRVGDFLASIGVQIKFEDSSGPSSSVTQAKAAMAVLNPLGVGTGIGIIRDEHNAPSASLVAMGAAGYKLDLYAGYPSPGNSNGPAIISTLQSYLSAGYLSMIEGPLEVDNASWGLAVTSGTTYTAVNGSTYSGWPAAIAMQIDLWDAFGAHLPVALFSLANPSDGSASSPAVGAANARSVTLSTICSEGNVHFYQKGGYNPVNQFASVVTAETGYTPGMSYVVTEAGFTDDSGADATAADYYGDRYANGAYTLSLPFVAWLNGGCRYVCIYELFDEGSGNTNWQAQQGLFDVNGNAKVSGTWLGNLMAILGDTGATARSFTPGTLNYTVSGLASDGYSLLLQDSAGNMKLCVGANANVYIGGDTTVAPSQAATIQLGATFPVVEVFDPVTSGTVPATTFSNVAEITINVVDHPLVVVIPGG